MKTNEEILAARAKLIAGASLARNEPSGIELSVVEFKLEPERYAVEEQYIGEVLILKELTPIPGVPNYVAGIANIRGRIVSILNLKLLLGVASKGITELNRIIILKHNKMEFGILADSILGSSSIPSAQLAQKPLTLQGDAARYVKGVTVDGLVILDCAQLLSDRAIIINHKQK
jgi:purine-binding chemotaxis protein CheW